MMRTTPALIALATLSFTLAASLSAQQAQPSQPGNGAARAMFDKADTNHDGMLNLDEWKAAGRRERGFKMIDANHDGQITPDELRAFAATYGR
jgi:Ca2+-binding EF-hand superfamily protein